MNILVLGGGGREHALCWKIAQSPLCAALYCAPGNPGIAAIATCLDLPATPANVIGFCRDHAIELVVIGPEQPLVDGLIDALTAAGIRAFGPTRAAAQLEGSKGFTKDLCTAHGIPTAAWQRFSSAAAAHSYVAAQGAPIVIKADGLAAGKGVVVAMTVDEAHAAVDALLAPAGSVIIVEEYLIGEEASFFVLCDGTAALPLASAQDHKRVGDGDTGPNTGGMGACSPAPVLTPALEARVMADIITPTLVAMRERGMPFKGVLFAGLMLTANGPKLIEYNVRFGDPECQTLMLRLTSDLAPALIAACDGRLHEVTLDWSADVALCVVMAASGYPGEARRGDAITGLEEAASDPQVRIFQAGTALRNGTLVSHGGRVLNICARAPTVAAARDHAYAALVKIDWPHGFYRHDIGAQAVKRGEIT